MKPTAGTVRITGHDIASQPIEAKKSLGVVPQDLALYEDLTGRQNIAYWATAYGLRDRRERKGRVTEILESVELVDRADDKVATYSGGMKRRLNFACGLVHQPKVLLLDEPTVAVDPQSRRKLLDLVREQATAGTSVVVTTHYMEEAQELCDEIAIVDQGRLIARGTLDELRASADEHDVLTLRGHFPEATTRATLSRLDGLELIRHDPERLVFSSAQAPSRLPKLLTLLSDAGLEVREVTLARPTLETLFLRLTGRQLRE